MNHQLFRIPYDVILDVIKILLAESDSDTPQFMDTLRTFSLVSRHFVTFCQKQLFRKYNMGKMDGQKCFSILQHSPHLIAYVREVWMYVERLEMTNVTVVEMELLRVLTSVHNLAVVTEGYPAQWNLITISVRRMIVNFLSRPQITSFTTKGLEELPFALFATSRYIKSLDIRYENAKTYFGYTSSDDDEDEDPDINFGVLSLSSPLTTVRYRTIDIRLENISLIDSDRILLYLLLDPETMLDDEGENSLFAPPPNTSPDPSRLTPPIKCHHNNTEQPHPNFRFSFTHLQCLTIDITANNLLPVWHLIHSAQESITTLNIRQRFKDTNFIDPFGFDSSLLPDCSPVTLPAEVTLGSLVNLRKLSITILILADMPAHAHTLSSWCSLLRTAPRGICTLEIVLDGSYFNSVPHLAPWFPNLDNDAMVGNTSLGSLDDILSSNQYFPSLEGVSIRVDLPEDERLSISDDGMIPDMITEQDIVLQNDWFKKFNGWCERHPSPSPSEEEKTKTNDAALQKDSAMDDAMGNNSVLRQDDNHNSESYPSTEISYEPSFSDESSVWSRAYPLPFERVEKSISHMLQLTAARFSSSDSFLVEVEFGTHSSS